MTGRSQPGRSYFRAAVKEIGGAAKITYWVRARDLEQARAILHKRVPWASRTVVHWAEKRPDRPRLHAEFILEGDDL